MALHYDERLIKLHKRITIRLRRIGNKKSIAFMHNTARLDKLAMYLFTDSWDITTVDYNSVVYIACCWEPNYVDQDQDAQLEIWGVFSTHKKAKASIKGLSTGFVKGPITVDDETYLD